MIWFLAPYLCSGPHRDLGAVQRRFSLFLLLSPPARGHPLFLSHRAMKVLWQSTFNILLLPGFFADWKELYSKKVQKCLYDKWEDTDYDAWQGRRNTVMCMQDGSERRGRETRAVKVSGSHLQTQSSQKAWKKRGQTGGTSPVCTITEG